MTRPMASRSKIADLVNVLYEAAKKPESPVQAVVAQGTYQVDTSGTTLGGPNQYDTPHGPTLLDFETLSDLSGAIPADFDIDSLLESILRNDGDGDWPIDGPSTGP